MTSQEPASNRNDLPPTGPAPFSHELRVRYGDCDKQAAALPAARDEADATT